jgi:hypothetical protein
MRDAGYSGKPLLDKLGIRTGARVAVIAVADADFERRLRARTQDVSTGRAKAGSEVIVVGVAGTADLRRLEALKGRLVASGAIWAVWPKGRAELKEDQVRAAALAAGLVDVKVCAFSETLSALKLVVPVAKRPAGSRGGR